MESAKTMPSGPDGVNEAAESSTGSGPAGGGSSRPRAVPDEDRGLDFVLDVPLKITVELGRTRILVQDLLKLHKGSVIELSKQAGDPLEILVNDRVLAKGEVIVVNEKFGIRLTDVVSHAERIRQLGE